MFKLFLVSCLVAVATSLPAGDVSRRQDVLKRILEVSKNGDGKTLAERMALNPKAKAWENSGRFQGDIVMDDRQIEAMMAGSSSRKALVQPHFKWPHNTVVYELARGNFTAVQHRQIMEGIRDIERHTCVRFRYRQHWDTDYVLVTNFDTGCYAHAGYAAGIGIHTMNLADGFCFYHTTVVHEWMHVLGFVHMQDTYNRDRYVTIHWENILPDYEWLFERLEKDVVNNLDLPYEYASVMHYDRWAGSKNYEPTMTPNYEDYGLMGQIDFITDLDWHRLNKHYDCAGAWE